MAPTKTVKNKHASKHAANGSGIRNSKGSKSAQNDPVIKAKKSKNGGKPPVKPGTIADMLKQKRKRKVYSEKELDIPALNMVTPVGVQKPQGKKKGKVFVDDRESMNTILAIVQAEKDGQIESKMLKARQMEAIREARKLETEAREEERKKKLDDTKDSLRKKRKRSHADEDAAFIKESELKGTRAVKPKKKRVSFVE